MQLSKWVINAREGLNCKVSLTDSGRDTCCRLCLLYRAWQNGQENCLCGETLRRIWSVICYTLPSKSKRANFLLDMSIHLHGAVVANVVIVGLSGDVTSTVMKAASDFV